MIKDCIKLHCLAFSKDKQHMLAWVSGIRNLQLEHEPELSE